MTFFSNLFGAKKLSQSLHLGVIGTDMHSHLIAGIDDGTSTINQSIELIKQMADLGYSKLITTPHIQGDVYKNTPEIIQSGLVELNAALLKENVQIEVSAAAEYLLDDKFEDKLLSKNLLTFGDNYILVELSYFSPHPNLLNFIFQLQIEGYKVILAHPERYSYWFNNFKKLEEIKERGVFFQLNMISLSGYYDIPVKKTAEKLVDNNMIDFLGTDMHNNNYMEGLKRTCFEKYLQKAIDSGKIRNNELK